MFAPCLTRVDEDEGEEEAKDGESEDGKEALNDVLRSIVEEEKGGNQPKKWKWECPPPICPIPIEEGEEKGDQKPKKKKGDPPIFPIPTIIGLAVGKHVRLMTL